MEKEVKSNNNSVWFSHSGTIKDNIRVKISRPLKSGPGPHAGYYNCNFDFSHSENTHFIKKMSQSKFRKQIRLSRCLGHRVLSSYLIIFCQSSWWGHLMFAALVVTSFVFLVSCLWDICRCVLACMRCDACVTNAGWKWERMHTKWWNPVWVPVSAVPSFQFYFICK